MKKSYHSRAVPTSEPVTTRRSSGEVVSLILGCSSRLPRGARWAAWQRRQVAPRDVGEGDPVAEPFRPGGSLDLTGYQDPVPVRRDRPAQQRAEVLALPPELVHRQEGADIHRHD